MMWTRRIPLPEMASLSSVPYFAECFLSGTRQRGYLPSAREKALGKQLALGKKVVCRVPSTRQTITLGKDRVCRVSGTRQTRTLGKGPPSLTAGSRRSPFAECLLLTLGKAVICRVSFFGTRQSGYLPSVIFWHSANHIFSLFISKFFLQSSYNIWYSMFQCGTFLGLFLYFFNLFHLIEFFW